MLADYLAKILPSCTCIFKTCFPFNRLAWKSRPQGLGSYANWRLKLFSHSSWRTSNQHFALTKLTSQTAGWLLPVVSRFRPSVSWHMLVESSGLPTLPIPFSCLFCPFLPIWAPLPPWHSLRCPLPTPSTPKFPLSHSPSTTVCQTVVKGRQIFR